MYIIRGFLKMAELDDISEGCDPDTTTHISVDIVFVGQTVKELIEKVKEYFDVQDDAMEFDACEDKGRLDIQRMENVNGDTPTEDQIERWKKGSFDLWAVTYTGTVERIETVSIIEEIEREQVQT